MALPGKDVARGLLALLGDYMVSAVFLGAALIWIYCLLGLSWILPDFSGGSDGASLKQVATTVSLEFLGSWLGGFACAHIAGSWGPVKLLAVLELLFGLGLGALCMSLARANAGGTRIELFEPIWMTFYSPVLSAAAILLGGRIALGRSRSEGGASRGVGPVPHDPSRSTGMAPGISVAAGASEPVNPGPISEADGQEL